MTPPQKPEHTFDYTVNDLNNLYTPPFAGHSARAIRLSSTTTQTRTISQLQGNTVIGLTDAININGRTSLFAYIDETKYCIMM